LKLRWENLDRDVASEPQIARSIDLAHPAGAKNVDDLVVANATTGGQKHPTALRSTLEAQHRWREF
jgi:hypothetical protein